MNQLLEKDSSKTDQETEKENTPAEELNQNDTVLKEKITSFYYSN